MPFISVSTSVVCVNTAAEKAFPSTGLARELTLLERYVLAYTTYTLEDMLADNDQTGYVLEDDSPPLFKMSLEYYLNEDGVTVNLPARGITYDMAKYKLQEVRILPFLAYSAM